MISVVILIHPYFTRLRGSMRFMWSSPQTLAIQRKNILNIFAHRDLCDFCGHPIHSYFTDFGDLCDLCGHPLNIPLLFPLYIWVFNPFL